MMLNRDKLNFWVKVVAFGLAAVFLLSSVFMGIGMTGASYNLLSLFGGGSAQQSSAPSASDAQSQVEAARRQLEQDPKDADNYKTLAGAYYQSGQYDQAVKTLEQGRQKRPKEEEIPVLMGQIYAQQAQTTSGGQQKTWTNAGDAFATATEIDPGDEENYYFAGQAYEQAGKTDQALKYWNGYLEREPDGDRAQEVKQKISGLLQGGGATGG